jgi:CrcB protein
MSLTFINLFAVMLGSAFGGVARHLLTITTSLLLGDRFPWGTLLVNVSGALLVGVLAALATGGNALADLQTTQLLLITGMCGSYTTVSSFSLQTLELARRGQPKLVAANVMASLGFCLVAVWMGWQLTLWLTTGGAGLHT